jgi:hypothetical protein
MAVALILFFVRRRIAAKAAASLSWPSAEGSITSSAVQSHWDQSQQRNTYSAAIQYVYRIEDVDYRSSRVAWGGRASSTDDRPARELAGRYPVGAAVRVHYNPDKRSEAVLEPSSRGGLPMLTFVMATFAVMGAAFILLSFVTED